MTQVAFYTGADHQPYCKKSFLNDVDEKYIDRDLHNILSSVRDLLSQYKMYSRTSESQVVSGGLQQYITNKLKRKDDRSLTDRLKALYLRDDTVQFNLRGTELDQAAMFDCLPVSRVTKTLKYMKSAYKEHSEQV